MSIAFDGSTQWLTRTGAILTAHPLLFGGWFNCSDLAGARNIISISTDGSANNHFDLTLNSGRVIAELKDTAARSSTTTAAFTANAWQHGTARYDSVTSRIAYLSGSPATENTVSCTPSGMTVTTIGAVRRNVVIFPFIGMLAHVCAYDLTGMSPTAVDTLIAFLAAGHNPLASPSGLVGYWPLANSADMADASGHGYTMTPIGSPTTGASDPTVDAPPSGGSTNRRRRMLLFGGRH